MRVRPPPSSFTILNFIGFLIGVVLLLGFFKVVGEVLVEVVILPELGT